MSKVSKMHKYFNFINNINDDDIYDYLKTLHFKCDNIIPYINKNNINKFTDIFEGDEDLNNYLIPLLPYDVIINYKNINKIKHLWISDNIDWIINNNTDIIKEYKIYEDVNIYYEINGKIYSKIKMKNYLISDFESSIRLNNVKLFNYLIDKIDILSRPIAILSEVIRYNKDFIIYDIIFKLYVDKFGQNEYNNIFLKASINRYTNYNDKIISMYCNCNCKSIKNDNLTLLDISCKYSMLDFIKYFINNGEKITKKHLLLTALYDKGLDQLEYLILNGGDINDKDLLDIFIKTGEIDKVKYLVENGINKNIICKSLITCIYNFEYKIYKYLSSQI